MFFELLQYRIQPGKRDEWVEYMETEIIPYQISKGMVVIGSFISPEDADLYVWIRRFENEEERKRLYTAVYENPQWTEDMLPKVTELIYREQNNITLLEATSRSVIQ